MIHSARRVYPPNARVGMAARDFRETLNGASSLEYNSYYQLVLAAFTLQFTRT